MATVLVVDDEADIRDLVRLNLELDGHHVLTARDGAEALDLARQHHPDVMLLDVMMPGLDGWEVLRQIKATQDREVGEIPVVMLTARAGDLDRIRGGIEGAVRYVTKPFDVDELRAEVTGALEGDPEPLKRKAAQHAALEQLARLEKGDRGEARPQARPRLTRFEAPSAPMSTPQKRPVAAPPATTTLSSKQVELLTMVGTTPTVRQAAEELGVSRSNVYASLRRIARKLGVRSVPELVSLARQGAFADR